MGLIACYYIADDNIINKTVHFSFDFESYLENNFPDEELKYLVYGQDTKSWNPLFELLKIIDTSNTKVNLGGPGKRTPRKTESRNRAVERKRAEKKKKR